MPQGKNMGRLNEDMKREIIAILGGMKDPRVQGFLTVMRVEVAPDLSSAKVFVSMLGGDNTTKDAAKALNSAAGHVRSEIAKRMHIRKAPELRFIGDESAAYAAHIGEVLADLHKPTGGQ